MEFWSSFENAKINHRLICRFIPYVTWSFGLHLKNVKYLFFHYNRYNIHNHRYHIVTFITKEQIFLHFQSKSKTVCC